MRPRDAGVLGGPPSASRRQPHRAVRARPL